MFHALPSSYLAFLKQIVLRLPRVLVSHLSKVIYKSKTFAQNVVFIPSVPIPSYSLGHNCCNERFFINSI